MRDALKHDELRQDDLEMPPPPAPRPEAPRRYLALWFPFLPTDRWRMERPAPSGARPDDTPLVLVAREQGGLKLVAIDRAARREGLSVGMTLADARARAPNLRVESMDPDADGALLARCVAAGEFFTPLAAADGGDGLILDITGCAGLFGGEEALLAAARRRFARLGLGLRAALADTPDAARALARFAPPGVAGPGVDNAALRALPVAALGLASADTVALLRAGLRTVGDLADRPSRVLAARFGADIATRLRRVMGQEDIRLTPRRPAPDCIAERRFPEPLTNGETLLVVLETLAGRIATLLERRGLGGWFFEASFFRADGATRRISIEMARGSRDAASLTRLLRLRLDTLADPLDPGFGFDAIRLSALATEPLGPSQTRLDGGESREADIADLVDRLVARLGRDRVLRFIARDTHDPARAFDAPPATSAIAPSVWPAPEAGAPPARPLQLFEPPQPIETIAATPDGPPLQFRWRRVRHAIARAEGPERIAPEWWRAGGAAATRDYYCVEDTQGRRFWVFREGLYDAPDAAPRWFMHGLFA